MRKQTSTIAGRMLRASVIALAMTTAMVATGTVIGAAGISSAEAAAAKKRFLRLGQGKSIVVRLPRGAADILIGDPKIVDAVIRSKKMIYIFAKEQGETNIFFLDKGGNPILSLDVEVAKDPVSLQKIINRALPKSHIKVEMMGDTLILSGVARTASEAEQALKLAQQFMSESKGFAGLFGFRSNGNMRVVNAMTIAGKDQVMLKMRIAEVQRSVVKQLGIDTQLAIRNLGNFSASALLSFPYSLGNSIGSSNATLTYNGSKLSSTSVLQAMERDGLMRMLAEPTLTAISGQDAKFYAGGEIPVVSGCEFDDNNNLACQYTMKKFGVALDFKPVVLSKGRISLKVKTEVTDVSSRHTLAITGGYSVPGFEQRSTETTVEIPSGGTLVIGGLIKETTKQNISGIPGLKNLPILGQLFRSRDFQSDQTELVIMITPYIVNPVNEKKLRTPVDRLNIASDPQTIFLGRLHRVYGAPEGGKGGALTYHGDVGFIIE